MLRDMIIPHKIHRRIKKLSKSGDHLVERGKYKQGIEKYIAALELVPQPMEEWEASTWLLTAIGDAHFLSGNYSLAIKALTDAMCCPNALGNPFIHLRLGQSYLEVGDQFQAADELIRAYMGDGKDIFENQDPKYFNFLKSRIKPPASGQW
jgi:tetratricopeptide (TPR) repeat protein